MEKKRRKKKEMNTDTYYIQGSAVRKTEISPAEISPNPQREKRRHADEERRYRRHLAEEKERMREFSPAYMAGFAVIAGLSLFLLGNYVKAEASLYMQSREIQNLQSTWDALVISNDAAEARMESSIDLNAIKDAAMNQYGMVYPDASQIREYEKTEEDYIRQYENIPD